MKPLRIGISPCPNDTFAFHGLLEGAVTAPGLQLEFEFADVEDLNRRFARGELDAAKCSFHAALHLAETSVVLPAGSALGFGVGPVLLARDPGRELTPGARVLCPGEWTTAHLLFRAFHPEARRIEQVVFSEILPRLARGEADFGVCIHEARFTFAARGLSLVEDLGSTWEKRTGCPLPLGGILARRELGRDTHARLAGAIRTSIQYGRDHRDEALVTMRRHARETEDEVLWKHVELYVNDATSELGAAGRRALQELARLAEGAGALEVFDCPASQPP
ncbi:MAG: 1,4-dihydroxy-6-naphthoate synthase [Planctomycetota bacterium]